MTPAQRLWVLECAGGASQASHIYPQMAACEAALESAFGSSALAREANNLFGMKLHGHPTLGPLALPTKEVLDGEWVCMTAKWMKYETIADCFEDRMATLKRLQRAYPHYADALRAADAYTYVTAVSQTWSTDPERASKVIAIYGECFVATDHDSVQQAVTGEL